MDKREEKYGKGGGEWEKREETGDELSAQVFVTKWKYKMSCIKWQNVGFCLWHCHFAIQLVAYQLILQACYLTDKAWDNVSYATYTSAGEEVDISPLRSLLTGE